jgi:hypothetical protein
MNKGQTIFSQVMDFVPTHEFKRCVERYHGSYKVQSATLQMPVGSRIIFQVDQTTLEDKIVLRYIGQCSENTNLDCALGVFNCRYH